MSIGESLILLFYALHNPLENSQGHYLSNELPEVVWHIGLWLDRGFIALVSSRFRNLVAFGPLHCKGLTIITGCSVPSSSILILLLSLDMNS